MAAKSKKVAKSSQHLVWVPVDKYAAAFALILILGGFFLAVKGAMEGDNLAVQVTGGLFIVVGFTATRLLKLIVKEK